MSDDDFIDQWAIPSDPDDYPSKGKTKMSAEKTKEHAALGVVKVSEEKAGKSGKGRETITATEVRDAVPALEKAFPGGDAKTANFVGTMLGRGTRANGVLREGLLLNAVRGGTGRLYSASKENAGVALKHLRELRYDLDEVARDLGYADYADLKTTLRTLPAHDDFRPDTGGGK